MSFAKAERAKLLASPRIGPVVVLRLEQVGLDSLAKLRHVGVEDAIRLVCAHVGDTAWANRRRALQRVLREHLAIDQR
ncbi:MAG: helix-hairpin-helix domain-containing protein [Chitinophagaceae bacterium]|nr:helix-hairpin-helix domain-containing protein [Rubrivivax sp.]